MAHGWSEVTSSPAAARSEGPTTPAWLWPNLLSLDAPAFAVTWQWMLARTLHAKLPPAVPLALALCVWAVYVLDRVLDGASAMTPRHLFAARYRKQLLVAVVAGLILGGVTLLPRLPYLIILRGFAMAAACGIYLLVVRTRSEYPKGAAMSLLCAAGIVLPFWNWPAFVMTVLTVWGNTRMIDAWEAGQRPGSALRLLLFCISLVSAVRLSRFGTGAALGCGLMLVVDAAGVWMSRNAVRCLLDWALIVGALAGIGLAF